MHQPASYGKPLFGRQLNRQKSGDSSVGFDPFDLSDNA
jgi:hypothetical protein